MVTTIAVPGVTWVLFAAAAGLGAAGDSESAAEVSAAAAVGPLLVGSSWTRTLEPAASIGTNGGWMKSHSTHTMPRQKCWNRHFLKSPTVFLKTSKSTFTTSLMILLVIQGSHSCRTLQQTGTFCTSCRETFKKCNFCSESRESRLSCFWTLKHSTCICIIVPLLQKTQHDQIRLGEMIRAGKECVFHLHNKDVIDLSVQSLILHVKDML